MTRRCMVVFLFAITAALIFGGGQAEKKEEPAAAGKALFEGVKLTLLIHPTLYKTTGGPGGIITEFEAATGAKVEVVTAPIPEHSEKALLDFLSGKGRYDVINMQLSDMTTQLVPFFRPYDEFLAKDGKEWEWEDIIEGLRKGGFVGGKQVGIPYRKGQQILYYRKDLFAAAGVEAPKDFAQTIATAKKLTKGDVFGYVMRGKGPAELAHDWLNFFYAAGGDFRNADGSAGFNSKAGREASQFVKDLFDSKVIPPDVFAWGRDDYITAMQTGRAAMGNYVGSYFGRFFGKDSVLERDQIGWALVPTRPGVKPGRARSGGWYWVTNKDSKNPEAAWGLVKAISSKKNQIREAVNWANGPVRTSTFEHPDYQKKWPQSAVMLEATANSATDGSHSATPKVHEILFEEVAAIMQGKKSVNKAMEDAARRADKEFLE